MIRRESMGIQHQAGKIINLGACLMACFWTRRSFLSGQGNSAGCEERSQTEKQQRAVCVCVSATPCLAIIAMPDQRNGHLELLLAVTLTHKTTDLCGILFGMCFYSSVFTSVLLFTWFSMSLNHFGRFPFANQSAAENWEEISVL